MNRCNEKLNELLKSYDDYKKEGGASSSRNNDVHTNTLFSLFKDLETSGLRINCKVCTRESVEGTARAYLRSYPFEITLCANRLNHSPEEVKEALAHEVTHAHDLYHSRYDFGSCEGLAHTEIRAAANAECAKMLPANMDQLFPQLINTFPLRELKSSCIKKHATRATQNLFPPEQAKVCVENVFISAMKDLKSGDS